MDIRKGGLSIGMARVLGRVVGAPRAITASQARSVPETMNALFERGLVRYAPGMTWNGGLERDPRLFRWSRTEYGRAVFTNLLKSKVL